MTTAARSGRRRKPFTVMIEQTGKRRHAHTAKESVALARELLEKARRQGHRVPRASFYANGKLVRSSVTRTDLAVALGRCWCGRGALRGEPGAGWCCAAHEALWWRMSRQQRARVIVARFLAIYGGANVR